MTVKELLQKNEGNNLHVEFWKKNEDKFDPMHETLFEGLLFDLPEKYHNWEVTRISHRLSNGEPVVEIDEP